MRRQCDYVSVLVVWLVHVCVILFELGVFRVFMSMLYACAVNHASNFTEVHMGWCALKQTIMHANTEYTHTANTHTKQHTDTHTTTYTHAHTENTQQLNEENTQSFAVVTVLTEFTHSITEKHTGVSQTQYARTQTHTHTLTHSPTIYISTRPSHNFKWFFSMLA